MVITSGPNPDRRRISCIKAATQKYACGIILSCCVFRMVQVYTRVQIEANVSMRLASPLPSDSGLLTVGEIKKQMKLPCNYIHDGFYLRDSNEVLNQVYQSVMNLQDDIIPVLIECGGHDGITKSLSLKTSRCLNMNTLLIEGSPSNFNILNQTRKYDFTVNAALCDGDFIEMSENTVNSGETRVVSTKKENDNIIRAECTSIDKELDKLTALLPESQRDKLELVFLVLDVEGHEPIAIQGNVRYRPHKVFMEGKHAKKTNQDISDWVKHHNLVGKPCTSQDVCYNFHPSIPEKPNHLKALFYGARSRNPPQTYKTSVASEAYMFYGK